MNLIWSNVIFPALNAFIMLSKKRIASTIYSCIINFYSYILNITICHAITEIIKIERILYKYI